MSQQIQNMLNFTSLVGCGKNKENCVPEWRSPSNENLAENQGDAWTSMFGCEKKTKKNCVPGWQPPENENLSENRGGAWISLGGCEKKPSRIAKTIRHHPRYQC